MRDPDAWLAAFLEHLRQPFTGEREPLRALLRRQVTAARAAWPNVQLAPDVFAAALGGKIADGEDPLVGLAQLRAADLYLAVAAANDAPGGVAAFDEQLLQRVPVYLARSGADATLVDEATQRLRVKLLVAGQSSPARIHQYSGRGALESWVCAAAVRLVRDLQRAGQRQKEEPELDVLAASNDPELDLLRARYQHEFRQALQDTLGELTARQRELLRLHFFEHLTTVEIARRHGVNQSTASRWLSEARQAVLAGVKTRVAERLRMTAPTLDSLLGLMHSRLDVSFSRLLAEDD